MSQNDTRVSFLYGARISESIATRTYKKFKERNVLTPWSVHYTVWDELVQILDDGGYARYAFSSATKLLEITQDLLAQYQGKLDNVHAAANDPWHLEGLLQKYRPGDCRHLPSVAAEIFLLFRKITPTVYEA